MKTIYNTYVVMESQEQCDRMKQLCIDNGLPIWSNKISFEINSNDRKPVFCFQGADFFVYDYHDYKYSNMQLTFKQVTEQEFIELLKNK